MKDKNDLKKEASKYTKDYTNEHIRKQIEENSTMFGFVIVLLAMGFSLILLSFIRAFIDIYPNVSVYRLLSEVLENHVVGIAFGVPLIVFACVGINEDGTLKDGMKSAFDFHMSQLKKDNFVAAWDEHSFGICVKPELKDELTTVYEAIKNKTAKMGLLKLTNNPFSNAGFAILLSEN